VIPVNGFYEWRRVSGAKTPFFIRPATCGAFGFAGIQQPLPDECVDAIRVSDYVNDARHDGAQCAEPVDALL